MIYSIYTIYIGSAMVVYDDTPDLGFVRLGIHKRFTNKSIELGFGDTTGKYNYKNISTNNFSKLLEQCTDDLYDLFMGGDGFFREPEKTICYPIIDEYLEIIDEAVEEWESSHPDCKKKIPYKGLEPEGYDALPLSDRLDISSEYDWVYGNLLWLQFWFHEAMTEEYPAIMIKPVLS